MKRLLLIMVIVTILMTVGCSKDTNNSELSSNIFDPQTVKVGDIVNGFTVKEVSVTDDGMEKVVFSGEFTMTGTLSGNIVDGGGPNTYIATFHKTEIVNNLPIATTWELDEQDSDYEVTFYLHSEENVTKAIGEERAKRIMKSIEDPWAGITAYKIVASLNEYTYLIDPWTDELSSLQLVNIQSIEDLNDDTNNEEKHEWESNLDEGFNIIENQSFMVEFENWGKVRFVPGENVLEGISQLKFYLADEDGRSIYSFPQYHGNENGCFAALHAVTFRDVNKDGLKDVIIIAEYMTGIGPQGATPFPVGGIYFQKDQAFVSVPELNDEINSLEENESIDMVVKFAEKKDIRLNIYTELEEKTDSGTYIKLIGTDQVEIRISGVPEAIPSRVFRLYEDVAISFSAIGLKEGDQVRFTYSRNSQNEDVITDIVKIVN